MVHFTVFHQADDRVGSLLARNPQDTVLYVLLPHTWSTKTLERLLAVHASSSETCIVHLVPGGALQHRQLESLAFEVYNRLPRLVKRIEVRGLPMDAPSAYLQYPAFTLASQTPPRPAFALDWPLRNYDVLNKWRLVHGAYGYDRKLGIMVAFVIDAEGEGWQVKTWRIKGDDAASGWIGKLWSFFSDFASIAAVEWRLTVSFLGLVSSEEIEGSSRLRGRVGHTDTA